MNTVCRTRKRLILLALLVIALVSIPVHFDPMARVASNHPSPAAAPLAGSPRRGGDEPVDHGLRGGSPFQWTQAEAQVKD